jgi:hypothetical protein
MIPDFRIGVMDFDTSNSSIAIRYTDSCVFWTEVNGR